MKMGSEITIGQHLIVGFQGTRVSADSPIVRDIQQRSLGGVILFDRFLAEDKSDNNISSLSQLTSLCQDLQHSAPSKLLISIDQEGGRVRRVKEKHGFPDIISARQMGLAEGDDLTTEMAHLTGSNLAKAGVNVNYAPVADVDVFPQSPAIGALDRSFSSDPNRVATLCKAWLKSQQHHKVLGCLKHFPGHGSATVDSHHGFTDITATWLPGELLPYRELINSAEVHAIMLGHLFHQDLDPEYPASLSTRVIQNILRKQLGFQGLVITDDLQMKAITEKYGLLDAIVLALAAGADLVIIGNNLAYDPGIVEKAITHIESALAKGLLSAAKLQASSQRITQIKDTYL